MMEKTLIYFSISNKVISKVMTLDKFIRSFDVIYLMISPTARTSPDFPLRGYAGPSGRLDVIARSITTLLSLPKFEDELFLSVLLGPPKPPKALFVTRSCVSGRPSEKSLMEIFRKLLLVNEYKGCLALSLSPEEVITIIKRNEFKLIYLYEKGEDISDNLNLITDKKVAFITGSHVDLPEDLNRFLKKVKAKEISLGPKSLLLSHALFYVHYLRLLKKVTCLPEKL